MLFAAVGGAPRGAVSDDLGFCPTSKLHGADLAGMAFQPPDLARSIEGLEGGVVHHERPAEHRPKEIWISLEKS